MTLRPHGPLHMARYFFMLLHFRHWERRCLWAYRGIVGRDASGLVRQCWWLGIKSLSRPSSNGTGNNQQLSWGDAKNGTESAQQLGAQVFRDLIHDSTKLSFRDCHSEFREASLQSASCSNITLGHQDPEPPSDDGWFGNGHLDPLF